ncbi:MAG: TonB-dependent receptor, partial [Acidobacteria bacterium]|nr:TonB-dependent receptor [Acidobacteriota bacterium]
WQTSSVGLPGVPPEYQQPRRYQNVPSNLTWDREKQGRLNLQWDSTFFFDAGGQHQLKAGVQLDRRTLDVLGGNSGNRADLFWDRSFIGRRGEYGYYRILSNPILPNRGQLQVGDIQSRNFGVFVQDSWTLGHRLTLNLGLRTESENVPSFSQDPDIPDTAVNWGFGDKLAPRLGFAWDVTGDGRTKLYGSWGVFYDIMKLRLPLSFGGEFADYYWYTLDDPDIAGIQDNPSCPPECPGDLIFEWALLSGKTINDPDDPMVDPNLLPTKLQEAVIGLERELAPDLTVGVRYIHKQLDRLVEDMGLRDEDGAETLRIGNPGFGIADSFVPQGTTETIDYPRARRDYDAVELTLDKRMSGRWGGRVSYLWSQLHGNAPGVVDSDFRTLHPNISPAWDSVVMPFGEDGQPVYGPLATDRTHQIKAQLICDLPFGSVVGASWYGASGFARSRRVRVIPGSYYDIHYAGRESDGRMPFTSRLDLQLQQRIRVNDGLQLTLMATVFNVFNQAGPVDYWQNELFGEESIDITEADFFAGFDTEELIEEQGLVRDARFMMDQFYQPPRSIRLGVRLSF